MQESILLPVARRLAWPIALVASSALAGRLLAENTAPAPAAAASPALPNVAKVGERLREGSKLADVAGTFQFSGDRVAFSPEGASDSLRVLENLTLERVSRLLTEVRGPRSWVVSGTITEFRGANYLLLTKALIQLETDRPAATP